MTPDMMVRDPINFAWATAAVALYFVGMLLVSWWRRRR